jgi:hypothetical protein
MNVRASSLLLVFLVACEGKFGDRSDRGGTTATGDVCASVVCPADGDGAVQSCQRWLEDPNCSDEASAFFACVGANRVCRADGTLDTSATFSACASESSRFQSCASSGG